MKRKVLVGLSTTVLLLALLAGSLPAAAAPPLPEYEIMDIGPELRAWEPTPDRIAPVPAGLFDAAAAGGEAASAEPSCILDAKVFLGLDDYYGYYFFDLFYLMADGTDAQIWVQADLSWPEGDPRPTPVITCGQAAYMLGEFESNIYPTEIDFFGPPDFHDGSLSLLEAWGYVPPGYYDDPAGRQVVLVENVRDDNYYTGFPLYIAGFFSPSIEAYFDRNTMTIDAYDWENRTGPGVARPYLYEGVFAHEYQHLLHSDYDPDEETWVNEGCSEFAQFLCGYGHPESHVYEPRGLEAYPENSLVVWEDQGDLEILADYGIAYLWTLNLYEDFGGPFVQAMFANPDNGITGVNSTLGALGHEETFADVYHKFAPSLVTDPGHRGGGAYAFQNIDFAVNIDTPEAYDTPGAPPWGTDFIKIEDPGEVAVLSFNGVDYSIFSTPWSSDGDVLWSGTGNLIDNWAIFEATGGGTLTFDTYYDIEDYWDFGFVQVSTDGGYTWTSLENEYTTWDHDLLAHPKVVENLPGLTGWSTDWVDMSFDLSAYSGDILIAFRYVTDWATLYEGWYIDNVYVDETLISDGSSLDPFMDITEVIPIENDFTVTLVGASEKKGKVKFQVVPLPVDGDTEEGERANVARLFARSDYVVMLVTFDAPEGFTGYANYTYELVLNGSGPK